MALTTEQKSSRLFKKSVGAGETLITRDFFEEPRLGRDAILPSQVWSEANRIPTTAPTLSNGEISGVVQYFDKLSLTHVSGTDNLAYFHDNLKNTIPFNYSDGSYNYSLYKSDGTTAISFGQGDWLVDTTAGILTFYGTLPTNVSETLPPQISFYKYVGLTGITSASSGLVIKDPVRVATLGETIPNYDFNLSGFTSFSTTIDSISSFSEGDRILIKDQSNTIQNGIFQLSGTSLVRAFDSDGTPYGEIGLNNYVFVESGNTNLSSSWVLSNTDAIDPYSIIPGVDTQVWSLFARSSTYTTDNLAIKLNGQTFSLKIDSGGTYTNSLVQSSEGIRISDSLNSVISTNTSNILVLSGTTNELVSSISSLTSIAITGATNGLSLYDKSVGLGGQLSATTLIDVNNKELSFLLSNNSFVTGDGFDEELSTLALQSDGKILCGGKFSSYSGITSNRVIRLNSDGSIDNTFITSTGFDAAINIVTLQLNGKILVGGFFTTYSGITSNRVIRLNSDGSIDNTFVNSTGFNKEVYNIALQSDGKILCGGNFTTYSGVTANRIIRLNSDGSIDNTFVTSTKFNGMIIIIALQTDGKILCGGYFTSYSGVTANNIIRLNSDGSIDNTFVTGDGFNSSVSIVALQTDGKILVSGQFTTYSGVTANKIIRLNSDGSIDNTFVTGTGFDSDIYTLALQTDGKILCGGWFNLYSGVTANNIIRLNSDGSIDNTFVTGDGFNDYVNIFAIQSDGKILCGGIFTTYSGVTANFIIRLNSDGSINNTSISNEIILKNNLIEYLNDASSYYTDRSLVDKGYISDLISTEVSTRTSADLSLATVIDNLSGVTSQTAGSGLTYNALEQSLNVNVDNITIKIDSDTLVAAKEWIQTIVPNTVSGISSGFTGLNLEYTPTSYVSIYVNGVEYLVSYTSAPDINYPFFFNALDPQIGAQLWFDPVTADFGIDSIDLLTIKYLTLDI